MDADAVSIQRLLETIYSNRKHKNTPVELRSSDGILQSISFTSFFLLYILPRKKFNTIEEMKLSTHPSNSFRLFMMMSTLMTKCMNQGSPEDEESLGRIFLQTIKLFQTSVGRISKEDLDLDEFYLCASQDGLDYMDNITSNWNYVRDLVIHFSHMELVKRN